MLWNVLAETCIGRGQSVEDILNSIQQIIQCLLRDSWLAGKLIQSGPLTIEFLQQFRFDITTPADKIKKLKN